MSCATLIATPETGYSASSPDEAFSVTGTIFPDATIAVDPLTWVEKTEMYTASSLGDFWDYGAVNGQYYSSPFIAMQVNPPSNCTLLPEDPLFELGEWAVVNPDPDPDPDPTEPPFLAISANYALLIGNADGVAGSSDDRKLLI